MSDAPIDWDVLKMINWGTEYFSKRSIPSPRLSIEWILSDVLKIKRLNLYLQFDRPLTKEELDQIRVRVKRRVRHEPLQYIVGHTDFMNARIKVNTSVLIPRPETEQLVEIILEEHHNDDPKIVMDVGTGSGCIPISLKMERPHWTLYGLDVSGDALKVATENAKLNQTDITFLQGDILNWEHISFPGNSSFDIIVSNPPYIYPEERESLDIEVREFEPEIALFYPDPMAIYDQIIKFARHSLKPKGVLYFEIHENFSKRVLSLFKSSIWSVELRQDYNKKDRFIISHLLV